MNNNCMIKNIKRPIMQNHCTWNADPIFGSRFLIVDHEIFIDISIDNILNKYVKNVIDPIQKSIFRSKNWIRATF